MNTHNKYYYDINSIIFSAKLMDEKGKYSWYLKDKHNIVD